MLHPHATITIAYTDLNKIKQQSAESYPQECCGLLIGKNLGTSQILTSVATPNVALTPYTAYEVDPLKLLEVEKSTRIHQQEIVGVYHSHPDTAAHMSEKDLSEAIPDFMYLILSVVNCQVTEVRMWYVKDKLTHYPLQIAIEPS